MHGSEQPPISWKCIYVVVTCKGNGRKEFQPDSFAPEAGIWGNSFYVASVCLALPPAPSDKGSPKQLLRIPCTGAVFSDVAKACVLK